MSILATAQAETDEGNFNYLEGVKIAFSNIIDYHLNWTISLSIFFFFQKDQLCFRGYSVLYYHHYYSDLHSAVCILSLNFGSCFVFFKIIIFLLLHIAELDIF